MRRMLDVGFLAAVLLWAIPAHAQTLNFARVDFSPRAGAAERKAAAPQNPASKRGTNEWRGGARFYTGNGSWDVVDEGCSDLIDELNLQCDGDDSGLAWGGGADVRRLFGDRFDLGLRGGFIRPAEIRLDGSGTFEGFELESSITGRGTIWTLGGELGVSPTPRVRLFGGAGVSPFTFDAEVSVSILDLIESEERTFSGVGRTAWGGIEWQLSDRFSLFGEAGRTWLKDDSVGSDEEPFDEAFTTLLIGIRLGFGF